MFGEILHALRSKQPHIHCITNYVTANDCANALLAAGALPIMADAPEESGEITASCAGLTLNLGTLSPARCSAMQISGKTANQLQIPVVLDPVGAGASRLRRETVQTLLDTVRFTAIRGNYSELKAIGGESCRSGGVDTAETFSQTDLQDAAEFAAALSRKIHTVIVLTGETDIVTDGMRMFCIYNGDPTMQRVTGAGCMLSALTAACAAAFPADPLRAAAGAVVMMGVCGELAAARLTATEGNAAFRTHLIDSLFRLTPAQLEQSARFREVTLQCS